LAFLFFKSSFQIIDSHTFDSQAFPNPSSKHLFEGIFGCIRPFISLWYNKANLKEKYRRESNSEISIPFEDLKNLQWLGSGAQGCVFKGLLKNEEVAIKKVKSKEEANIKHLLRLNHENLVKFKGVSFNGDKFFCIIMEYCPYGQLYTRLNNLKEKSLLKPSLMIDWAKQIARGMNYLHLNKFIHRDLKSPK
jgi:mitogen-activated protein kinase kinase kinase 13